MDLTQYEILVISITLVGGWLKFQADYNKLSARVKFLEDASADWKADVKQLLQDIQEIKLLLAKNKVE
ncbi:MAG: hypothetical protein CL526_12620 [Aequorivita sp.]|nr:hypothetical protein [Aequorivita sp.]|tara:strand:- start:161 stop:364 length:204 start_codon:yes stop_codon:yes gene_type:complete